MTKEYTGAEFEIEFARADYEWKLGGKVGVDPRTQWESECHGGWTRPDGAVTPTFSPDFSYRWKPIPKRTVWIGYKDKNGAGHEKELVAPEVEAPPMNSAYFHIFGARPANSVWNAHYVDMLRLDDGELFLTLEDAAAMAEWLAVCRKGGAA